MNFIRYKNNFEGSKERVKLKIFCSGNDSKFVMKFLPYKIPLLFNLYENRLIHSEFLEEVFRDFLEKKEILGYDFQKKIFSIYLEKSNLKFYHIYLVKQCETLLLISIIILLLRSFPYVAFLNKNKKILLVYKQILLRSLKLIFTKIFILANKLIRKIRSSSISAFQKLKLLFLKSRTNLFSNYISYTELINDSLEISQKYNILFNSLITKKLVISSNLLEKLFIILTLNQYFRLKIIIKKLQLLEQ